MSKPYDHLKAFINKEDSLKLFKRVKTTLPWRTVTWSTGRTLPRRIFRYGDDGKVYKVLEVLKTLVEKAMGRKINGIWCNLYEKGSDWCPEHKDSYGDYVYTLSLGQTRNFYLKNDSTGEKTTFLLEGGDLFYFSPAVNATHKHCIPKTASKKMQGERISIVFFS